MSGPLLTIQTGPNTLVLSWLTEIDTPLSKPLLNQHFRHIIWDLHIRQSLYAQMQHGFMRFS